MEVYKAINAVSAALAASGIAKDRKNESQKYNFRGIDDIYNALAPILSENKLCILPRCIKRECVERSTKGGSALFYVTVEAEFDLVSAVDDSKHTVKTFGEAMDSADKATNKAMSAAYKYAAFQTFCIPTEGDNDADATTHEVQPERPKSKLEIENPDLYKKARDMVTAIKASKTIDDVAIITTDPDFDAIAEIDKDVADKISSAAKAKISNLQEGL